MQNRPHCAKWFDTGSGKILFLCNCIGDTRLTKVCCVEDIVSVSIIKIAKTKFLHLDYSKSIFNNNYWCCRKSINFALISTWQKAHHCTYAATVTKTFFSNSHHSIPYLLHCCKSKCMPCSNNNLMNIHGMIFTTLIWMMMSTFFAIMLKDFTTLMDQSTLHFFPTSTRPNSSACSSPTFRQHSKWQNVHNEDSVMNHKRSSLLFWTKEVHHYYKKICLESPSY